MCRQRLACLSLFVIAISVPQGVRSAESIETKAATLALHQLLDNEWQRTLQDDPEFASWLGDKRYDDRWQDLNPEAIQKRHEYRQSVLKHLATIDSRLLSKQDRISYELLRGQYQDSVDAFQFDWHLVPLTQRDGIQDASSLASSLRFETVKDYEAWNARLYSFPEYMDQTLTLMQEGVDRRIVHARVVMTRLPAQIRQQIVEDPTRSLFYKPFREMPKSIPTGKQEELKAAAELSIRTRVVQKMLRFFENVYLPACFEKVGAWQIPNGKEFYALRARQFTTTDLTPQQIHDIGQREVNRVRGEMEKIIQEVGFEGSFAEFLEHLRTDPQYYYEDPNELLTEYKAICRRIDPQLPKMFGRLPRRPYQLKPIPKHLAPDTTTAYYRPPSADGGRDGTYFVNLFRPETRPKYEMEVLSVHEAVPGHHLQIALAQELEGIPEFRRFGGYTAFIEGWGLYSESLGYELGLYKDPYSRFGQLTYDMWRAVRLVVDTGIHDQGWSRQQAIDFFAANAAKSMHDIENEIDRYIAWPGQALAYKIGQLRILELRRKAEKELGDKFDLRDFHDTILGQGAVTLHVLDGIVEDWIAERKKKS
jgi:uncharacterized protein (DUF885 family)